MNRNTSIEFYRCLLMFGICLLHSIGLSSPLCKPAQSMLLPCVVAFVFVSGWFGIQLRVSKILRLVGTAFICSIIVWAVDLAALDGQGYKDGGFSLFTTWYKQWWFLNAYLMLMIVAPFLNCIIDCLDANVDATRMSAIVACWGILLCTFVFGFSSNQFGIKVLPRNIDAFFEGPCSFAVFAGIYVAARISRRCADVGRRMDLRWVMLLCALGMIGVLCGGRWHNSPFSLMVAATTFVIVKDIKLPYIISRFVTLLSPSMFAVYLLHSHKNVGFVLIAQYESTMSSLGVPTFCIWLTSAVTIFSICVVLDMPRRIVAFVFRKYIAQGFDFLDRHEKMLLNWMGWLLSGKKARSV